MFVSRLTICIAAWNSMDFLPALLSSITKQSFKDISVVVIDNASQDGLEAFLRKEHPSIMLLRNVRNLGRSAAYNQAIRYVVEHSPNKESASRYVLFIDPHVILEESCLEQLIKAADERPSAAAFCPVLLRAYSENAHDESLKETIQSERIESCGFTLTGMRTVQMVNPGKMHDQTDVVAAEIFGSSSAMNLVRLSGLVAIGYTNMEVFDPLLSEGMENIDLSWRLQLSGFGAWCIKEAKAYHHLGKFKKITNSWWSKKSKERNMSINHRRQKSAGYWLIVLKNESFFKIVLLAPRFALKVVGGFFYALFFDRVLFSGASLVFYGVPHIWQRRRHTQDLKQRNERQSRV